MLKWNFDLRESTQFQGWEDSNAKLFKGSPYKSLGKEITQNSIDAANNETEKVCLKFKLLKLPSENIPGNKELLERLRYCLADVDMMSNEVHKVTIQNAIKTLEREKIRVLKIEELSGTGGMEGPSKEFKKAFHVYMKGSGKSVKPEPGARGSQGEGKGAPINLSDINTIFVSTNYYDEENKKQSLIEGRTHISSHFPRINGERDKSICFDSIGYFGENFGAFEYSKIANKPEYEWLKKNNIGTDIFIIGFREDDSWFKQITPSILISYFAAIENKNLEVKIEHPISGGDLWERHLKASDLEKHFNDTSIKQFLKNFDSDITSTDFEEAGQFWKTFKNSKERIKKVVEGIGELTFHIGEKGDDSQKNHNIGLIRREMFITNLGDHKSSIFQGFSSKYQRANIIIEANSIKTSDFFVELEPPDHNKIELTQINDPEKLKKSRKALQNLKKEIIEIMDKHFCEEEVDPENIDFFDDWLVTEGDRLESKDFDPFSRIRFNIRSQKLLQVKRKTKSNETEIFEEDIENDLEDAFGSEEFTPVNPGPNPPGPNPPGPVPIPEPVPVPKPRRPKRRNSPKQNIELINPRIIISNNKAKIFFTPTKTCRVELELNEYGADIMEGIQILEVNDESANLTEQGTLELNVIKNERVTLDIELDKNNINSVKLLAGKV